MKLTAAIFLSSGAFLLFCAMGFFAKASKQAGHQAAFDLIGPGLGILFFAILIGIIGMSLWKKV